MIKDLRVKNLKAWDDSIWESPIALAPVTLFLGTNSSGKTSLMQTLLLMKQTFSSPDRRLDLNLGGQDHDLVDFGSYQDAVYAHEQSRHMGFGASMDGGKGYEVCYTFAGGQPVTDQLVLKRGNSTYSATRQPRGGYLLCAPGYTPRTIGGRLDAKRPFAPERSLAFSPDAVAELGTAGSAVQDLSLEIGRCITSIAYLGPLRQPPERFYLWSRQAPNDLGDKGQFAVAALLASANSRVKSKDGVEGGRGWLVEQTSTWLQRLGIADSLAPVCQGRSRFFEVMVTTGGQKANIMDVGFGVSQVLPFVVLSHFVPKGTTIIAEQPEIHLHPRVQSGLADLMAEVSRTRQIQFLIETHSEHLFRRVQTLVAKGPDALRAEDCRLYFVDKPANRPAVLRDLGVDEYGRIAKWPDEFFGDAVGEVERQTELMLRRIGQEKSDV